MALQTLQQTLDDIAGKLDAIPGTVSALLTKFLSTVFITAPKGSGSAAAGEVAYNIYSINDWMADAPSITVTTETAIPSLTGNNILFVLPITSTATPGVAPSVLLKWTAQGWRVKMLTFFIYRAVMAEINGFRMKTPPGADNVTNGAEISWPKDSANSYRAVKLMGVGPNGNSVVLGSSADTANNMQCMYVDNVI